MTKKEIKKQLYKHTYNIIIGIVVIIVGVFLLQKFCTFGISSENEKYMHKWNNAVQTDNYYNHISYDEKVKLELNVHNVNTDY